MTQTLVTATHLVHWADTRSSQGILPALVRRLILGTVDRATIQRIEFPAEDSVSRPGTDGILQTTQGTMFVPGGQSVWEMGVGDPAEKANGDYEKRTEKPGHVVPAETGFVFVTPRRWQNKHDWVAARRRENAWTDVVVHDADDLEQWLETCPAVSAWACRLIRELPAEGMTDLQEVWTEWQYRTTPHLTPHLLVAGRAAALERVRLWLRNPAATLRVRADSAEEALAFLAAVIECEHELERARLWSRALVVSTPVAWRAIATQQTPTIMVALTPTLGSEGHAVQKGHHVFVAYGNESAGVPVDIVLPHPRRDEAEAALHTMGIATERARSLVTEARGRVVALIDLIGGCAHAPRWAAPHLAAHVLPLFLAGRWSHSDADMEAMGRLARTPVEKLSRQIAQWCNEPDPPVRLIGDGVYEWISRRRGWPHLSRFVTRDDLVALESVATIVLGEIDPRVDLPAGQRWMAALQRCSPRYSDDIREGLASGLAFLATFSDIGGLGSNTSQTVTRTVQTLFGDAADPRRWYSLASVLPTLAEAAPNVLLDVIERDVLGNQAVREQLFEEEGPWGHSGRFHYLLWALERLAWSPLYLSRVSVILASLAKLGMATNKGNSPTHSLRGIFLAWHPHTRAKLPQRLGALDAIARQHEDVAFRLCLELMPRRHDVGDPTDAPRWRDWASGDDGVTNGEFWDFVHEAFDRTLAWVQDNAERLAALVEALPDVEPARIDGLIAALELSIVSTWTDDQVENLRRSLRRHLHRARTIEGYKPHLSHDQMNRLEAVYYRLEPLDPVRRWVWLFSQHPDLLSVTGSDWNVEEHARDQERTRVVSDFLTRGALDDLLLLADHAQEPGTVGYYLGRSNLPDDAVTGLLETCFASGTEKRRQCGRSMVWGRFQRDGWSWVNRLFSEGPHVWSPEWNAEFALGLRFETPVWDWVENWGSEAVAAYWRTVRAGWGPGMDCDAPRAIQTLLNHERPFAALHIAWLCTGHTKESVAPGLLFTVLQAVSAVAHGKMTTAEEAVFDDALGEKIAQLLETIEAAKLVDLMELAQIEWTWLPVLEHTRRGPAVFHRLLAHEPGLFAQLVGLIYRSHNPVKENDDSAPDELTRRRATQAARLLLEWRDIPGRWDNGPLDSSELRRWVQSVREQLRSTGHLQTGDRQIGELLARVPPGTDGSWPHEAVRELIEECQSQDLDDGLFLGVRNGREAGFRSIDAGGEPERELSRQYCASANATAAAYPRTSKVLQELHESYEQDARHWDNKRNLREYS